MTAKRRRIQPFWLSMAVHLAIGILLVWWFQNPALVPAELKKTATLNIETVAPRSGYHARGSGKSSAPIPRTAGT